MSEILAPLQIFTNADSGYLYIGTLGENPITSPISVYFDADLTLSASQPLRISGSYIVRNGSPARIYTAATSYTIAVYNHRNRFIYSEDIIGEDDVQTVANNFAALASTSATVGKIAETKGATADGFSSSKYIARSGSVSTVNYDQINSATANIYWDRMNKTSFTSGNNTQNVSDYATLGVDLLPGITTYARTNFDASRVHAAGTVGILSATVSIPAQTYCILHLTITTTTAGYVDILVGADHIMDDNTSGYWFSTDTIYADGIEQNRVLTTTDYYFYLTVNSTPATAITLTTDTLWSGTITNINMSKVTPIKMVASGSASDDSGLNNPIGIKLTGFNRNDMAFGDKYALGAFQYDGAALTPAHNFAAGSRVLASLQHGDENTGVGSFTLQYNEGSNNTGGGYSSFKRNTKGQENSGWGYKSFVSNTTGSRNCGFGFWAAGLNLTGSDITAMGWYAGRNNIFGSLDSYFGSRAGMKQNGGAQNVYIGAYAGYGESNGASDSANSYQVSIGSESWAYGDKAVTIGFQAKCGTLAVPAANAIAVGANVVNLLANTTKVGRAQTMTSLGGRLLYRIDVGSVTSGVGETYSAADFLCNWIERSGPGAPFTDVTPTAVDIIALMPDPETVNGFDLYIRNVSTQLLTLNAGVGVTLNAAITVPTLKTRLLKVRITDVAAKTVLIFPIGLMDN